MTATVGNPALARARASPPVFDRAGLGPESISQPHVVEGHRFFATQLNFHCLDEKFFQAGHSKRSVLLGILISLYESRHQHMFGIALGTLFLLFCIALSRYHSYGIAARPGPRRKRIPFAVSFAVQRSPDPRSLL